MNYTKMDLLLADRHLNEALDRIDRQRAIIAELEIDGGCPESAYELLATLEECLDEVRSHRDLIVGDLAKGKPRGWLRLRPQASQDALT